MRLERINCRELTAKQQETHNFEKLAALLADYGFNCIKLDDDWQSVRVSGPDRDAVGRVRGAPADSPIAS